jgi:hypothetical protein
MPGKNTPSELELRILTATNRKLTGIEAAEVIQSVRDLATQAADCERLTAIVGEIEAARDAGDMCAFWAAIGKL